MTSTPHPTERHHSHCDIAIIGGGAAGLAAAVQLSRSRRSVVVIDAGEPRNAPAAAMHGYLGFDGRPPAELLAAGRAEATGYGAAIVDGVVTELTRADEGFVVVTADGNRLHARRVLLATGLVDELPDIPGVAERWGHDVLHCPYCHGWEVRDTRIAVLATSPMSVHQALLFRQLSGAVTVVAHVLDALDAQARTELGARGIRIVEGPAQGLVITDGAVTGVRTADGEVAADTVVVTPRMVPRADIAAGVGLHPEPGPMPGVSTIPTDQRGATTVPGLYAAGNVTDPGNQVLQAAAEGARIAAMINMDLVTAETTAAVAGATGDDAGSWDRRYAEQIQRWSGDPNPTLPTEVEGLTPGTALDVGSGEGADALWLAQRGWQVTAIDIAPVATERARAAGAETGLAVDWRTGDITAGELGTQTWDLVTVHYPALAQSADDAAIRALLGAVAPGGTLLIVGHHIDAELAAQKASPWFEPGRYVQPGDIAARLDSSWEIQTDELRPHPRHHGPEGHDVPDMVLRARRS